MPFGQAIRKGLQKIGGVGANAMGKATPGLGPSAGAIGGMMGKFLPPGMSQQRPMQPQIKPSPQIPMQQPAPVTAPAAPPPESDMQSMAGAMGQQEPAGVPQQGLGPQMPMLQNMMGTKRRMMMGGGRPQQY